MDSLSEGQSKSCSSSKQELIDKKRAGNWTKDEEIILIEEVQKREEILFRSLQGCVRGVAKKTQAWQDVCDVLNARNISEKRTAPEIKKKYSNIKQKAKLKKSLMLHPPTGGGKKPPSPTVPEQLVLDNLEGRPSLEGLDGGFDTSEIKIESIEETIVIDLEPSPVKKTTGKKRKSDNKQLETEILEETRNKIKEEIELIREKRELIKMKKRKLDSCTCNNY